MSDGLSHLQTIAQRGVRLCVNIHNSKFSFKKMMRAEYLHLPFSISVDKNVAYPEAFTTSQEGWVMLYRR